MNATSGTTIVDIQGLRGIKGPGSIYFPLMGRRSEDIEPGPFNLRYRICPNKFIVENICQACIDLACKVSGTVCCTIEQNACYAAAPGDEKKAAECRNKFIQCLGGYRGKPKLPKGPGDGEI